MKKNVAVTLKLPTPKKAEILSGKRRVIFEKIQDMKSGSVANKFQND